MSGVVQSVQNNARQSDGLTQRAEELRLLTESSATVLALASGGEVRFGCSGSAVTWHAGSAPAVPRHAGSAPAVPRHAGSAPASLDTLFDLASITKVMATTASIMRLVTLGALGVDDRVSRYLPAFSGGGRDAVTLRDLLLHRGGLQPWWPVYCDPSARGARDDDGGPRSGHGEGLGNEHGVSREAALDTAARLPLAFAPHAARHYSDLGFMLLGAIVERAAGQRLDLAARELVFDPLCLAQTGFRAVNPRSASGSIAASARGDQAERRMVETGVPYPVPFSPEDFGGWRDHLLVGEANDGNAFHAFGGVAGHAGLFSSVGDLLTFGISLSAADEHTDLFAPDVVAEFFAPGPDPGQCLGFRRYEIDLADDHGEENVQTTTRHTTTVLGHPGFTGTAFGFVPPGPSAPSRPCAFVIATNRILAPGDPVPNDRIWETSLPAWRSALAELAPHLSRHPKEA